MDTQRLLLFVALGLVLFVIVQTWRAEHQPPQPVTSEKKAQKTQTVQTPASEMDSIPIEPETEQEKNETSAPGMQETLHKEEKSVVVTTDVFALNINANGNIGEVKLLRYPVDVEHPDKPFSLLSTDSKPYYIAQTGIKVPSYIDKSLMPGHTSKFTAVADKYDLGENETLEVPLKWSNSPAGIEVIKKYIFHKNSYVINVKYEISNNTDSTWKGGIYGQLRREGLLEHEERGLTNYSYTGGVYYNDDAAYNKLDFDEFGDDKPGLLLKGGKSWAGFIQHYFTGAVLPNPDKESTVYNYTPGKHYVMGARNPFITVAPGASATDNIRFFLGPKLQDEMEKASQGLKLTVDYGWLKFIAEPIFWVLKLIQSVAVNWGVAIVLITILIKLIFFKLSEAGYRSMARMRKLQPRLEALKERYGDDRAKFQQAMMKLYREEKINPMGGCFPIIVQIPVFIALYWVLLESVELRQASFLWLNDLSIKDPFFILPIIMGASMVVQQKLNPAPMDPLQQKLMMALPLIFTVFFAFFPSGLVLYWVVNNIISIAQQWVITKRIAG